MRPVKPLPYALCAAMVLSVLGACGDDGAPKKRTSLGKDAGTDASFDAAMDAGKPPLRPLPDAGPPDAGHDAGRPVEPPSVTSDMDAGMPSCDDLRCGRWTDDCNVGVCDPATVTCIAVPRPDNTPCGSTVLDNCTLPDRCQAGVCLPRNSAKGTPCGHQGGACHYDDACDGEGQCTDKGLRPVGTACGSTDVTDPECDAPDTCDAQGQCAPNHAPVDAPCGNHGVLCRVDDACDGLGYCVVSGNWQDGSLCGRSSLSTCHPQADVCVDGTCQLGDLPEGSLCGSTADTECDHPDTCQAGSCAANAEPEGVACGDQITNTECNGLDSCDGAGSCASHLTADGTLCGGTPADCRFPGQCDTGTCSIPKKPDGAACGDQNKPCLVNDSCDASGACIDHGEINPCTISGTIYVGAANPAGVTVSVPALALSDVTDANGMFQLSVPLHQDLALQVQAQSGYYGLITGYHFTPQNAGYGVNLSLPTDSQIEAPATFMSRSVDRAKGVVMADFYGTSLNGDEGLSLSAPSAATGPIVKTPSSTIESTTIMSTAPPTTMYFYDVQGSSTTLAVNSGATGTCQAVFPGITDWPVAAHTSTEVAVVCSP